MWLDKLFPKYDPRPFNYGVYAAMSGQSKDDNPYSFEKETTQWLEWNSGFASYKPRPRTPITSESSTKLTGDQKLLFVIAILAAIGWNALFVGPLMGVVCVAFLFVLYALDVAGLFWIFAFLFMLVLFVIR